jgi:preprotein translocase subunit SecF
MAVQHRFVEIIKPGTDIDLIGKQRYWIGASIILVLLTFFMLIANAYLIPGRGRALNWGVDFRGGTEITIEFSRPVDVTAVRAALDKAGYPNSDVVKYYDKPNSYMIRMGTVSVITPAHAEKAKAALARVGDATLAPSERGFMWSEGGDKLYLRFDKPVTPEVLTAALRSAGVPTTAVRQFGRAEDHAYEVTLVGLDTEVTKALNANLGAGAVARVHGVASVGAKAGKQLQLDGLRALVGAILLIVIYVAFRFDFRYGPGTIVALLHDAVITVGAFAVTYKEFSLTTLAALLTIIGFSMNDTIVVFDRIRENATRYRDRRFDRVVNQSINETLSRTILTSATVFFVTLAMNIFGTGVIRDFAFAMNVGVIVGTYSSIFIASPILIWLNDKYNQSQKRQSNRPDRPRRPVRQEEEPAETP